MGEDDIKGLVVKSRVYDYIKSQQTEEHHIQLSGKTFFPALDEKIKALLDDAIYRAGANKRVTILERDL